MRSTAGNHSETPNVKKVADIPNDRLIVVALRDIEGNEELRSTYMSAPWRRCFIDTLKP